MERASDTHSSAVRSFSVLVEAVLVADEDVAVAEEAEAGMKPTLYVPNPMAGWGVPSYIGTVGQLIKFSFMASAEGEDMFRIVSVVRGGDDRERLWLFWLFWLFRRRNGVIERKDKDDDKDDDALGDELARSAVSCSILIGNNEQ